MTSDITIKTRSADLESAQFTSNLPKSIQRILVSRGLTHDQDIDCALSGLLSFARMKGMDQACQLLAKHIQAQNRILIVGDFDADGATSTALLFSGLGDLGARHVSYLVPNRFEYGYGLTPEIVELAAQQSPALIITVDNGISSFDGVALAKSKGIEVLITDHHLQGAGLPAADGIINPNQHGCEFESKAACGCGVVFYLLSAMRRHLQQLNWFEQQNLPIPNMAQYLDLVALATVADVVPLDKNNRILVEQGLRRIRAGQARYGIQALLEVAKRDARQITSTDLGFAIGPRLNAAGRMDDMSVGIECLLASNPDRAIEAARLLDDFNRDRKQVEQTMQQQAQAILESLKLEALPKVICIFQPDWHQGVVGLLASRIKERYHRPVIAFAPESEGSSVIKGSARSIEGVHIRDLLDLVAKQYPHILSKFGGHAMAAGLSIQGEHFKDFEQGINFIASSQYDSDVFAKVIETDGELSLAELDLSLVRSFKQLLPWGQGCPAPLFHGQFKVLQTRVLKEQHIKFVLEDSSGSSIDAIYFFAPELLLNHSGILRIKMVYETDINEFRGQQSVQLITRYVEVLD